MHKVALPEKHVYGAIDFCRMNLDPMGWCADRTPGSLSSCTFVFRDEESAVAFSARFSEEIEEHRRVMASAADMSANLKQHTGSVGSGGGSSGYYGVGGGSVVYRQPDGDYYNPPNSGGGASPPGTFRKP